MIVEPTKTWLTSVEKSIRCLFEEYSVNRGLILTEGDLECHLFNKLLQDDNLKGYHNSKNDSVFGRKEILKTTFVHSQVTWFRPEQKSGFEVDLTIADPKYLEVFNIELFEGYTSKGFAYDGPCIAIELKFIRNDKTACTLGQVDYLKFINELIPSKLDNIKNKKYVISNQSNIAFYSIVGCKNKEFFEKAVYFLGKHIVLNSHNCPENLFVCIFYQDEILFDKDEIIRRYESVASSHSQ